MLSFIFVSEEFIHVVGVSKCPHTKCPHAKWRLGEVVNGRSVRYFRTHCLAECKKVVKEMNLHLNLGFGTVWVSDLRVQGSRDVVVSKWVWTTLLICWKSEMRVNDSFYATIFTIFKTKLNANWKSVFSRMGKSHDQSKEVDCNNIKFTGFINLK